MVNERVKFALRDKMKDESFRFEEIVYEHLMEDIRRLPKLPKGWEYDFSVEQVYNEEHKGWEFKIIATPVQKYVYGEH